MCAHAVLILGLSTSGSQVSAGPRRKSRGVKSCDERSVQNYAVIDAYSPSINLVGSRGLV